MIPEHIIDKAARALYERDCKDYFDGGGTEYRHPWHEVAVFSTARPYQKRARATLEAVATEIWWNGYEVAEQDLLARPGHLGSVHPIIDTTRNEHT